MSLSIWPSTTWPLVSRPAVHWFVVGGWFVVLITYFALVGADFSES